MLRGKSGAGTVKTRVPLAVLAAMLAVTCCGCSARQWAPDYPVDWKLPDLPLEEVRASIRSVSVKMSSENPETEFRTPTGGFARLGLYFLEPFLGVVDTFATQGPLECALAPGWFLVDLINLIALFGEQRGYSSEEVKSGLFFLHYAVGSFDLPRKLADRVAAYGARQTDVTFVDPGDAADAVLEIGRPRVLLWGRWRLDPRSQFVIVVEMRLRRVGDGAIVHSAKLAYKGNEGYFVHWTHEKGVRFQRALEAAVKELGERIVDEAFLTYVPLTENGESP